MDRQVEAGFQVQVIMEIEKAHEGENSLSVIANNTTVREAGSDGCCSAGLMVVK